VALYECYVFTFTFSFITPWVGATSNGDGFRHRWGRNGEFCVVVRPIQKKVWKIQGKSRTFHDARKSINPRNVVPGGAEFPFCRWWVVSAWQRLPVATESTEKRVLQQRRRRLRWQQPRARWLAGVGGRSYDRGQSATTCWYRQSWLAERRLGTAPICQSGGHSQGTLLSTYIKWRHSEVTMADPPRKLNWGYLQTLTRNK